ncbi:hypothetical protein EZV62_006707 [Acer yangbiense]|uniref:Uncharacterized protein n=1 Tax=Acer yangbiense TaxID=1000413 RepID=A0A5C7I9R9_9ROSI|nr:hypothetical protein EZV62_006707 [Acer yangbiense]
MVCLETRQAVLVQGIDCDAHLQDTWRHPGGVLPDGEGSRGHAQQALHFRAKLEDGDDVLHRRLREGGGLDQLHPSLTPIGSEIAGDSEKEDGRFIEGDVV